MRLAIVAREFPPDSGGIGESVKLLASGLARLGHECTVLTDEDHPGPAEDVAVVPLPIAGPDPMLHWTFAKSAARYLRARLDSFDVIHLHFPECLYVPLCLRTEELRKVCATVHTTAWGMRLKFLRRARARELAGPEVIDKFALSPVSEAIERISLSKLYHVAAVSASISDELRRGYGLAQVGVIPNGVEDRQQRENPGPEDTPVGAELRGIFIGSLRGQKGLFRGLEAIRLTQTTPRILAVGSGPLTHRLTEFARQLGIVIQFPGYIPRAELEAALNDSCFLLCPSFYEGHSLAVLEACRAKLPVAAFGGTGVEHSISAENRELLPPNGNLIGLARLVDELVADRSLRKNLGEANRKFAETLPVSRMVRAYDVWFSELNSLRWWSK